MKHVRIFVTVLLGVAVLATAGLAQSDNDKYLELIRQDLRTGKVAYMTEGMDLSPEKAEVFWPIYNAYLEELRVIGDQRVAMIKDYAAHWDNLSQDKAAELMKTAFKLRRDQLSLLEKTAKKVSKDIDPVTAGRFVQVENALNLLIDVQLASEIPLFQEGTGQ